MGLPDLSGSNIQDTYQRVLHTSGGAIFDGTGSTVPISFNGDNVTVAGTLTAQTYVVSESVVNVTSGSTIFGNSSDDTHTFTGDITASEGNLSIEHASSPKLIVKDTNNNRKLEIEQGNIFSIIRFDDHTTQDLKFISNNDGNHLVLDAGNGFTGLGTDTPGE